MILNNKRRDKLKRGYLTPPNNIQNKGLGRIPGRGAVNLATGDGDPQKQTKEEKGRDARQRREILTKKISKNIICPNNQCEVGS